MISFAHTSLQPALFPEIQRRKEGSWIHPKLSSGLSDQFAPRLGDGCAYNNQTMPKEC